MSERPAATGYCGTAKKRVAIIGAGPAGLMAAEQLAQRCFKVTVYERMPSPARKFLMAGRGGLNLTHSEPLAHLLARYGEPADVIGSAVRAFPPDDLITWVKGLSIDIFTGSSGRVFPLSMKASPLLRAWLKRLAALGVQLETRRTWRGFDDQGRLLIELADGSVEAVGADAVLLALGGASWPRLGSDGAWVSTLQAQGVNVTPLQPSNCGVEIAWSDVFRTKFEGEPLKRICISCGGVSQRGEAIITRRGLEGGVVYALGSPIRNALTSGKSVLSVDLRPDIDTLSLANRLERAPVKESLANTLRKAAALSPAAASLVREAGPPPRDPLALAARIKAVPLTVTGLAGLERAISTAGGVAATSIDGNLMLIARPGVFVAGEMLDFDAPTGGYLLQAAFATGAMAAAGIAQWLSAAKP